MPEDTELAGHGDDGDRPDLGDKAEQVDRPLAAEDAALDEESNRRAGLGFGPRSVGSRMQRSSGAVFHFRDFPLRAKIGIIWILIVLVVAILAPLIAPFSHLKIGLTTPNSSPSWPHIMGADEVGRDIFSRVIFGARVSALVSVVAPLLALIFGGLIGMIAASASQNRRWRWVDDVLMRVMDIQFAFPAVVLAIVFATVFGPSLTTLLVILSIVYSPILARFVRATVRDQLAEDYVAAQKAIGSSQRRILFRHVLLNIATPLLVFFTLVAADAVVLEASISFLGAGIRPPTPSWGNMIRDGQRQLLAGTWWYTTFPGLAIFTVVVALNSVAESMADKLGGRRHLMGKP